MLVDDVPDDVFRAAVAKVYNKTTLERTLFKSCRVGRVHALSERIQRDGIDTSHWTGRYTSKRTAPGRLKGNLHSGSDHVKEYVVKHGFLKEECSICRLPPQWQGKHLTLHLDHIDGNKKNHEITNLRFLCPNCHQQTETWGAKRLSKLPSDEQMIAYLKQGMLYKEIATLHDVHQSTVSHRVKRLMMKFGVFQLNEFLRIV